MSVSKGVVVTNQIQGQDSQVSDQQIQQQLPTTEQMQAATGPQQTIVPQASPQVQPQPVPGAQMTQVMSQGPQATPPHGVTTSMPPQSPQFYVQASVGTAMQAPPAIAPAPGPQTTTTTVSALHQPIQQHHLAAQTLAHPGVSPSPMPQFQQPVQVIQGGLPSGQYIQQLYQNPQGQLMLSTGNLTLQTTPGMGGTQIQPGTINPLNSPIQVITAATGKPFQGQIAPAPHMIAGGKAGVLQTTGQTGCYNHSIPTSGNQTVLISQLGAPLGVINNAQATSLLPTNSAAPKQAAEMQKVGNMQAATLGQMSTGLTWAPGAIQSPLFAGQNQQIFIRGTQPGQENVFIHNAQAQAMVPPNSMVSSLAAMPSTQQPTTKGRTGMETQANIQPKVRPALLPSVSTAQMRPGSSVSTQTASGQPIAPAQIGMPRNQGKNRKNSSRASPIIASQQQPQLQQPHQQLTPGQILQTQTAVPIPVSIAPSIAGVQTSLPVTVMPVSSVGVVSSNIQSAKAFTQATPLEAITNIAQAKPGTTLNPAGIPNTGVPSGVRLPSKVSATSIAPPMMPQAIPTAIATVPAPSQLQSLPTAIPVSITTSTVLTPVTAISSGVSVTSSENKFNPNIVQLSTTNTAVSVVSSPAIVGQPQIQTVLPQEQPALNVLQQETSTQQFSHSTNISQVNQLQSQIQVPGKDVKAEASPKKSLATSIGTTQVTTTTNCTSTNTTTVSSQSSECNGTLASSPMKTIDTSAIKEDVKPLVNGSAHSNEKPLNTVQNATGPPKAMVKPHVLTHVIEGFVIHEASEPFPVSRSSRLTDTNKSRSNVNNTATVAPQANPPENEDDQKLEKGELAKCELCNKTDLRSKFKKSKRFCSSCVKRKRKSPDGSPSKRPKVDEMMEEIIKDSHYNMEEIANTPLALDNGVENTNSDLPDDLKITDIMKWTVNDVVKYIKNLPELQDYAADFELHQMDGQALMLLEVDHLMSAMNLRLGPALKIYAKIKELRSKDA